ncbi:MAG TPA: DNA topoisomerase IB, partial [Alphaproteobacteria bacterium]|nr:DNA topoisomerase IB [Alphaproteobacteria bacterium]
RARVRHLAIPPAWEDVRIAPDPLAHIQACGVDASGRLQYLYHPEWEVRRTRRKQRNLAALAAVLPGLRRRVRRDLEAEAGEKALAIAIAVALIDGTAMRVGRERYLASNGTRGAGTLFTRDVAVRGEVIHIRFPAKSGKAAAYVLKDARLAAAIGRVKTVPGERLLMYRDAAGAARALRTDEINAYLREVTGVPVTAKDFRTLHASALAGEALAQLEPGASAAARRRQVAEVIRKVAAFLQNTPAICRKSYVAPLLLARFDKGTLAAAWNAVTARQDGLRRREIQLGALLLAGG